MVQKLQALFKVRTREHLNTNANTSRRSPNIADNNGLKMVARCKR